MITTDLSIISHNAAIKEEENFCFREELKNYDSILIDQLIFNLNESISSQIDCTACGNCCRSLMINVDDKDADRLATYLHISKPAFDEKYVERSTTGTLAVMNAIPCHFLHENKCRVYEARPDECREFPGLHRKGFTDRLFATFMHYGRCPIIYNVIEGLKEKLEFATQNIKLKQ
jgi:Fe-S-cluster containining protein